MPIEIRELVIKAVVEPDSSRQTAPSPQQTEKSKKQIVEESVEQTLKIIEKKQER